MDFIIKLSYQASRLILMLFKPLTVGVRLLMVRDDQVLLVKHVYEESWYLPGGLVEKGETLEGAARREAFEETGATLDDLQLYGTFSNFKDGRNDHIIVFLSRDFILNGYSDHEISALSFYPMDALPENISSGSKNRVEDLCRSSEKLRYGYW
jgi:8-oxo-dGTP pyrophosphatase MutT (NUDIX family)